jgi:hypothetical protein
VILKGLPALVGNEIRRSSRIILRISRFLGHPELTAVRRYGTAVISVGVAVGIALLLRHDRLPHPFTTFSFAAIAITFWCAGTGPGLLALLISYLALRDLFVPINIIAPSSEYFLVLLWNIWRGRELV